MAGLQFRYDPVADDPRPAAERARDVLSHLGRPARGGTAMPDIGLYQTKYALRRWLDRMPGVRRLSPNAVSVSSLVPSTLAAVALWAGWWPLVVLGIAGRMVLTVMDGLIAEAYGKKTRIGPYVNRLPQEIGDAMLFLALLAWADPAWVALLLVSAWLVNVLGVLPGIAGGSPQPAGPAGQPDRIAIVLLAAIVACAVPVDWTWVCVLIVVLSIPTALLRIRRTVRELGAAA
jgi:phosphatidylglycerophosphate synthase